MQYTKKEILNESMKKYSSDSDRYNSLKKLFSKNGTLDYESNFILFQTLYKQIVNTQNYDFKIGELLDKLPDEHLESFLLTVDLSQNLLLDVFLSRKVLFSDRLLTKYYDSGLSIYFQECSDNQEQLILENMTDFLTNYPVKRVNKFFSKEGFFPANSYYKNNTAKEMFLIYIPKTLFMHNTYYFDRLEKLLPLISEQNNWNKDILCNGLRGQILFKLQGTVPTYSRKVALKWLKAPAIKNLMFDINWSSYPLIQSYLHLEKPEVLSEYAVESLTTDSQLFQKLSSKILPYHLIKNGDGNEKSNRKTFLKAELTEEILGLSQRQLVETLGFDLADELAEQIDKIKSFYVVEQYKKGAKFQTLSSNNLEILLKYIRINKLDTTGLLNNIELFYGNPKFQTDLIRCLATLETEHLTTACLLLIENDRNYIIRQQTFDKIYSKLTDEQIPLFKNRVHWSSGRFSARGIPVWFNDVPYKREHCKMLGFMVLKELN